VGGSLCTRWTRPDHVEGGQESRDGRRTDSGKQKNFCRVAAIAQWVEAPRGPGILAFPFIGTGFCKEKRAWASAASSLPGPAGIVGKSWRRIFLYLPPADRELRKVGRLRHDEPMTPRCFRICPQSPLIKRCWKNRLIRAYSIDKFATAFSLSDNHQQSVTKFGTKTTYLQPPCSIEL